MKGMLEGIRRFLCEFKDCYLLSKLNKILNDPMKGAVWRFAVNPLIQMIVERFHAKIEKLNTMNYVFKLVLTRFYIILDIEKRR